MTTYPGIASCPVRQDYPGRKSWTNIKHVDIPSHGYMNGPTITLDGVATGSNLPASKLLLELAKCFQNPPILCKIMCKYNK